MKAFRDHLAFPAAVLVVLAFAASPALAQSPSAPVSPHWGTGTEISYYVGAAAFHASGENSSVVDDGMGAAYLTNNTVQAWAPINLPQGALITGYDFYYYDAEAQYDIKCRLREVFSTTGGWLAIGPYISSSGSGGWGSVSYDLSSPWWTVNNGAKSYQALVEAGNTAWVDNLKWHGVRVRYKLQVAPAPGVASFSDVPTSYWAFQWIEALKASGITQGVTPTTYEPESNVTRAQMAVFLAKALGLHWQ